MSEVLLILPSVAVLLATAGMAVFSATVTSRRWTRRIGFTVAASNTLCALGLIILVAVGP
jgi:hypothetical protein